MSSGARRILSNALLRTAADLGGKVATLVLFGVMGRRLGDDGFGVFVFALSFVTLVTALSGFGHKTVLTRAIARDRAAVDRQFTDTLVLQLSLGLPVLGLVVALGPLLGLDETKRLVVGLLGVAVVAEALAASVFAVAQAYERLGLVPVVVLTQRWFTAGIAIAALLAGAGVVAVAAIYLACAAGALVLALVLLRRWIVRPRAAVAPRRWPALFRAAFPIGIAGLLATVMTRADTTLLAAFDTDAVVGQYGAAYRLYESTFFVAWAISAATYPVVARRSPDGPAAVRPVVEGAYKLALALGLPLAALAALAGGPAIRLLFGDAFDGSERALALLAPAVVAYPLAAIGEHTLIAHDAQGTVVRVYVVGAVSVVVLGLLLIPPLGLEGAAIAASAGEAGLAAALLLLVARRTGGLDLRRVAAGPLLATAALAACLAVAGGLPLLSVVVGGLAYLAVLLAWERARHPEDAALLADAVRRRRGRGAAA